MTRVLRVFGFVFLFGVCTATIGGAASEPFPQWGDLQSGSYAVGFRHIQEHDYSRQIRPARDFTGATTGDVAYPIQIGLWYPAARSARGVPMTYGDFMLLALKSEQFTPVTAADRARVRDEVKSAAAFARDPAAATEAVIDQTLAARTASLRDARPAPGRFPVVLICGPAITAATVLSEYLASHGYVVMIAPVLDDVSAILGNAFASSRRSITANVARAQGSKPQLVINDRVRAFEYLAAEARSLPFADSKRLALVGINYDSMGALIYQMQHMRADAVVSINGWETIRPNNEFLLASPSFNPVKLRVPYLNFHWDDSSPADLSLVESLKYSERSHYVVDGLDHFSLVANPMAFPFSGAQRKTGYAFLVRRVRDFLDRNVKSIGEAGELLGAAETKEAPGVTLKSDWRRPALRAVPSPAEFARILREQDIATAARVFREARAANPDVQLFGETDLNVHAFRFARLGRKDDIVTLRQLAVEAYPKSFNAHLDLGEALQRAGRLEESERAYDRANQLGVEAVADPGIAYFDLGACYAVLGSKEKALAALEKAVASGFTNRRLYEGDASLASLRNDPRFRELLARLPS